MARKYEVSGDDDKETVKTRVIAKFRDAAYRRKLFHWIWLPCGMMTLGIIMSQNGPTFPDIQIITDTDGEKASNFFTSGYCGYMVGSFLSGFVHSKINNNVVMTALLLMGGGTTIATPYFSTFALMMVIKFIVSLFAGGIDTTLNAEHMRIWGNDGQTLCQLLHFSYALGGVVGPLFTAPFLAEKEKENKTVTPSVTSATLDPLSTQGWTSHAMFDLTVTPNSTRNPTEPQTTEVHYAYLIGGIIMATAALPFFIMIFEDRAAKDSPDEKYKQAVDQRQLPTPLYVFMALTLTLMYLLYSVVETSFASYLLTFVIDEYEEVTKAQGSYITSFYWAAFAAARFGSIFTSKFLSAVRLLYLHFFLMLGAYTGFALSAYFRSVDALTAFACLAGIAMSAIYPAGFSWTEAELMLVTGRVSAAILIGSSLGGIIAPFIMGYLMENVANIWFCYVLICATSMSIVVFLFLLLFNRLYVNRKYGTVEEGRSIEKQVH